MKQKIIDNFNKLITREKSQEKTNVFKIRSYVKVIKLISQSECKFDNYTIDDFTKFFKENGMKNPKKTIEKINQILETGEITQTKLTKEEDQKIKAIQQFTTIYAVGPKKAKELYVTYKIKNIDELRKKLNDFEKPILNNKQLIGLQYYEDLLTRIPRKEIQQFEKWIQTIIKEKYNNQIKFTIAGSYRRQKKDSGDIDLLITSEVYKNNEAMKIIIKEMKEANILKETLAKGKKKFMGIISIENQPCRHLDIVETTKEDYPFAILYFTGSGPFNVKMRKNALDQGYSINEYAMTVKKTGERVNEIFNCEEDIFKFLNMKYKLPKER